MATLYRVRRTQLNASANQIDLAVAPANIALVGFHISNAQNTTDSYVGFYNNTSGNVTPGVTTSDYGRLLVPASSQIYDRSGSEQNPLFYFQNGLTVFAATTETGSTSPTNYLTIELFYYK